MPSIVLVGPRCCGKTSVGMELASRLDKRFVDADQRFAKQFGDIKRFVDRYGWEEFRRKETIVLERIARYRGKGIVLAPGGGAVAHSQGETYRKRNTEVLRSLGDVFYLIPFENLEESAVILAERLSKDKSSEGSRPSLTKEDDACREMLDILEQRDMLYRQAAHKTVHTGKYSVPEIADIILEVEKGITPEMRLLQAIFGTNFE